MVSAVFPSSVAMTALDVAIDVTSFSNIFEGFFRFQAIPAGAMGRRKTDRATGIELLHLLMIVFLFWFSFVYLSLHF